MDPAVTKVQPQHLNRTAFIYIRQSTMTQVRFHRESTERQYALKEKAITLGWSQEQVQVVDEDLGLSGSQASTRQGFQRLVAQVSLGQVGAIFGLEISRLARSSADLHRLLELCALFDTIVIDEDGIYNLNDFNDRLILGFKGTMSEAELHFLRSRLLGGKKNKAHKGELRFTLPVGYCRDEDGNTIIDPDESVQTAVRNVFDAFHATGSAYGVIKFFYENNLRFPKRAYGGVWKGKLVWSALNHSRVIDILYNPAYTGAYVYGRFKGTKMLDDHGSLKIRTVRMSKDNWEVLIPDHHPAYISWQQYEENLRQLLHNRTNVEVSGPAREGLALMQGLLLCGKCGHRMTTRYTGNGGISPRYECRRISDNGCHSVCSSLPCRSVDQVIEAKIMEALQPTRLELALLALDNLSHQEDKVGKTWHLALEQAQYEVDRAQRQYDLSEPENRLVVRSLEARWNEKLAAMENLKKEHAHYLASRTWVPTSKDREEILSLADKLPRIWNSSQTTMKDRKRIVRILIEDVTVNCRSMDQDVSLGIRWRNNYCEVVHALKPLPSYLERKHPEDTINVVRDLATRMTDSEIARHLNDAGHRTPENRNFTKASISWLRYRYRIPGPKPKGLTVKQVAEHFAVSTHVVYYWLENGMVSGTKPGPGRPWQITVDEDTERNLIERVNSSGHLQH